ncbi:MAG: TPM domain-containing protein [Clostridiaceae bacterium]|jgi:uncharacterized protein|nr:TPM domain-containing protein [Clostridiaceae bacterium]
MLVFLLVSIFAGSTAYASNPINVVDDLGYLSDIEIQQLQARIDAIKSAYTLDTVIVITDDTKGKDSTAYADDYYDYNDYGLDSQYSGLLLLINMDIREVAISTTGRAIDIYTNNRIGSMINNVTSLLSDGDYYAACNEFINNVITYADYGVPKGQYREERDPDLNYYNPTYLQKVARMLKLWPVYIIPLIISIAATLIISHSSKGKVTTTTRTYEKGGSFVLNQNTDQFIRENTTRTRIQSQSSGGGGRSSTHRGSSGRSHGGGRGRF